MSQIWHNKVIRYKKYTKLYDRNNKEAFVLTLQTREQQLLKEGKYNEAVVPLPDGRSIPVEMRGGGDTVVVNVNVSSDGQTTSALESDQGQQAANLGRAISVAVTEEIYKQKRPGGALSPYG